MVPIDSLTPMAKCISLNQARFMEVHGSCAPPFFLSVCIAHSLPCERWKVDQFTQLFED